MVAAGSSVYIEHRKLLSLTDGASVSAADGFTLRQLDSASGSTDGSTAVVVFCAEVHPPVVKTAAVLQPASLGRSRVAHQAVS